MARLVLTAAERDAVTAAVAAAEAGSEGEIVTTLALVITVMAIPFAVWLNRLQRRLSMQGTGA